MRTSCLQRSPTEDPRAAEDEVGGWVGGPVVVVALAADFEILVRAVVELREFLRIALMLMHAELIKSTCTHRPSRDGVGSVSH